MLSIRSVILLWGDKMENEPLISLIVPVYNVSKYLKQCFESILNQTYNNIEIIAVDDGSTDDSADICDKYAEENDNFIVIHQDNQGLAGARNTGLKYSHGEVIMWVDSDDYVAENFCEEAAQAFEKDNPDIVCFGYYDLDAGTGDIRVGFSYKEEFTADTVSAMKALTVPQESDNDLKIGDSVCTKAFRRAVFNGVSFPIGSRQEDLATMYRLIDKASSVKMIPAVTYYYRINRYGSLTNTKAFENSCDMMFAETERFEFLTDKYPDLAELIAKNIVYMLTDIIKNIARICRSTRQFEENEYAKKAADCIRSFWKKNRKTTPLKNTDLKHKVFLDMFSNNCNFAIIITGLLGRTGIWT